MTNFARNRELRRIDFELKVYRLDADINQIWRDLEDSDDPKVILKHFERVQYLVETHRELVMSGIKLDISYDEGYMMSLAGMLFDRYCELI